MEEKIEVGEYVRTDNGIDKFLYKDKYKNGVDKYIFEKTSMSNPEYYVLKHSKNIINLIEVGDYVNGYPVKIVMGKKCNFDLNEMAWVDLENIFLDGLIENIVTKEQFESIKYEVKDEL